MSKLNTTIPPADNVGKRTALSSTPLKGGDKIASHINVGDPLCAAARAAQGFRRAARSAATDRAYKSDWKDFANWCAEHRLEFLPADPSSVALYLAALAERGRKPATISRRITSISREHLHLGYDSPCDRAHRIVTETMQGIKRKLGTRQIGKEAMTVELLRHVIGKTSRNLSRVRDRALLLVGFAGGMRRSELAAIRVEHLVRHSQGITVYLPSSKTD